MVDATAIRGSITALIDNLGSTVSVRSATSSVDKWGNKTNTLGSASNITAVPDNLFNFQRQALPQGILNRSSMVLICKGTESIAVDDLAIYNGRNYKVINVQPFPINNVDLAIQFALEETHDNYS